MGSWWRVLTPLTLFSAVILLGNGKLQCMHGGVLTVNTFWCKSLLLHFLQSKLLFNMHQLVVVLFLFPLYGTLQSRHFWGEYCTALLSNIYFTVTLQIEILQKKNKKKKQWSVNKIIHCCWRLKNPANTLIDKLMTVSWISLVVDTAGIHFRTLFLGNTDQLFSPFYRPNS